VKWSKSLPNHVESLSTYEELGEFVQAFANGHLGFVILLGPAGVGKSRIVNETVGADACRIDGTASPLGVYMQAWEHINKPLILDDVDGLYANRSSVRLMKCLCQTEQVKKLSWETNAVALSQNEIPRSFTTTSRVAIIANRWDCPNADVAALLDRGHAVSFEPDPWEVHREAARWFWDQEVFDFVAEHLHLIGQHSLRTYVLAHEKKQAQLPWQRYVLSRMLQGNARVVAEIVADSAYESEGARVAAFVAGGHGCRATWYAHRKKIHAQASAREQLVLKKTEQFELLEPEDPVVLGLSFV
jgi:hypothetical protein